MELGALCWEDDGDTGDVMLVSSKMSSDNVSLRIAFYMLLRFTPRSCLYRKKVLVDKN